MNWLLFALLSAAFAALTAIFGKVGVEKVPSNLAVAIRTVVVLVFAWGIAMGRGELSALSTVTTRGWIFLCLSGAATGLSWLAYYRALQLTDASRVAPVDKLSLALTVVFAAAFLGEHIGWKTAAGVALIVGGAHLTLTED